MAYVSRLLRQAYFRYYRWRYAIPHRREIYVWGIERVYLRELAKLYCSGFNLQQCAAIIKLMTCPEAPTKTRADGSTYKVLWLQEKQFYGREHTRERLRQLIWKIWRDQHVVRKSG